MVGDLSKAHTPTHTHIQLKKTKKRQVPRCQIHCRNVLDGGGCVCVLESSCYRHVLYRQRWTRTELLEARLVHSMIRWLACPLS